GRSEQHELAARATGPLPELWAGAPRLALSLSQRWLTYPESRFRTQAPSASSSSESLNFERKTLTRGGHAELTVPLIPARRFPALETLDLQAAARIEHHTATGGTLSMTTTGTGLTYYSGPTLNEQPYF